MRRVQGYAVTIDPEQSRPFEEDTFSCSHCNCVVFLKPFQNDAPACRACDAHICDACAAELARTLKCVPIERRLEAMEARDKMIRAATG